MLFRSTIIKEEDTPVIYDLQVGDSLDTVLGKLPAEPRHYWLNEAEQQPTEAWAPPYAHLIMIEDNVGPVLDIVPEASRVIRLDFDDNNVVQNIRMCTF